MVFSFTKEIFPDKKTFTNPSPSLRSTVADLFIYFFGWHWPQTGPGSLGLLVHCKLIVSSLAVTFAHSISCTCCKCLHKLMEQSVMNWWERRIFQNRRFDQNILQIFKVTSNPENCSHWRDSSHVQVDNSISTAFPGLIKYCGLLLSSSDNFFSLYLYQNASQKGQYQLSVDDIHIGRVLCLLCRDRTRMCIQEIKNGAFTLSWRS